MWPIAFDETMFVMSSSPSDSAGGRISGRDESVDDLARSSLVTTSTSSSLGPRPARFVNGSMILQ